MSQLMSNEPTPLMRPRRELAGAEHHVAPDRIGASVHVAGRSGRVGALVNDYIAEVAVEALLHSLSQRRLQRRAGAGQDTLDTGRCGTPPAIIASIDAPDARLARNRAIGRRHHLSGNAIRLLLVFVAGFVDLQ